MIPLALEENLPQPQHCPNLWPRHRVYECPAEVGLVEHTQVAAVRAADVCVLDMMVGEDVAYLPKLLLRHLDPSRGLLRHHGLVHLPELVVAPKKPLEVGKAGREG